MHCMAGWLLAGLSEVPRLALARKALRELLHGNTGIAALQPSEIIDHKTFHKMFNAILKYSKCPDTGDAGDAAHAY